MPYCRCYSLNGPSTAKNGKSALKYHKKRTTYSSKKCLEMCCITMTISLPICGQGPSLLIMLFSIQKKHTQIALQGCDVWYNWLSSLVWLYSRYPPAKYQKISSRSCRGMERMSCLMRFWCAFQIRKYPSNRILFTRYTCFWHTLVKRYVKWMWQNSLM